METPEAKVISDLGAAVAAPTKVEPGDLLHVVVPEGYGTEIFDAEHLLAAPRRKVGTVNVHNQESFGRFVRAHSDNQTVIFANKDQWSITAVFNADTSTGPGWSDHRANFALRQSKEWQRWTGNDRKLMTQVDFAQHIEDGLDEVIEPPAAEMLELAQTFHAKTGVTFQSSQMLASGQRQFTYAEDTTATAGGRGEIRIPDILTLGICPFEGVTQDIDDDPNHKSKVLYKLTARFRFRIDQGHLRLGYHLVRPEDVIEDAFNGVVDRLSGELEVEILRGEAPAAR